MVADNDSLPPPVAFPVNWRGTQGFSAPPASVRQVLAAVLQSRNPARPCAVSVTVSRRVRGALVERVPRRKAHRVELNRGVIQWGGLAARRNGSVLVDQTDDRGLIEERGPVILCTGFERDAAFEIEDRLQAAESLTP